MPRRRNPLSQPTRPPSLDKNHPAQPTHLPRPDKTQPAAADLRERLLADFAVLRVPLRAEQLDAALSRAEHDGLSHVQFLHLLIGEQADQRRERSIAQRIREARFRDPYTLAGFDWQFNAATIDRVQIDFEAWEEYLDDAPLAMALLDWIVDGAIILKMNGKSYRAHRAQTAAAARKAAK